MPNLTGPDLRHVRESLAMTQQGLADALGYHVATINKWENGARPIPAWVRLAVERLAQVPA